MRAREVIRVIEGSDGYFVRQVGSHARYRVDYARADGSQGHVDTAVPRHPGDIPSGTLRKIQKDLTPALGKGWLL